MKQAYPNFTSDDIFVKPVYNLNKWLNTMQQLYTRAYLGQNRQEILNQLTHGWNEVEKQDFQAWMNFYQGGNQRKYKMAQFYVNDNIPGYFLPNQVSSTPSPVVPLNDPIAISQNHLQTQLSTEEKRKILEDQRRKMLGRLTSFEKLLGSKEGHELVGDKFAEIFNAINEIKRQIHLINKKSLSNQLYKDLIIREANKLSVKGSTQSAQILFKFAQNTPGNFDAAYGPIPLASQIDGQGSLGNVIPTDAMTKKDNSSTVTPPPPVPAETESADKDPIDKLLENLETGGFTDMNKSEDTKEEDVVIDDLDLDNLIVEAQMMPVPAPASVRSPIKPLPVSEKPADAVEMPADEQLEVGDTAQPAHQERDIDALIDSALSNITTQDIIDRLENVISVFRNRQLSRELTIVDMMMHRAGLIALFPELTEAITKTMESHSYVLTRLEKIISQLRGTVAKSDIDLQHEPTMITPENKSVQETLQRKQDEDKNRKEMRKQLQDQELTEKLQTENLSQVPGPTAPVAPVAPAQEVAQQPAPTVIP